MFCLRRSNTNIFFCEFEELEGKYSFWKPIPITNYINFIFTSQDAQTGPAITPTLAQYLMSPTDLTTRFDKESEMIGLAKGLNIPFKLVLFYSKYDAIMEGPELNFFIKMCWIPRKTFRLSVLKKGYGIVGVYKKFDWRKYFIRFQRRKIYLLKLNLYKIFFMQHWYCGIPIKEFLFNVRGNILALLAKKGKRRKYV